MSPTAVLSKGYRMEAISLWPEWAHLIFCGFKSIEVRTWKISAPRELLLCTSKQKYKYFPGGYAVGIMKVADCVPFTEEHLEGAWMLPEEMPTKPSYAWMLDWFSPIKPFPVKGKVSIYNVDKDPEDFEYLDTNRAIYDAYRPLLPELPKTFEEARAAKDFGAMFFWPEDE